MPLNQDYPTADRGLGPVRPAGPPELPQVSGSFAHAEPCGPAQGERWWRGRCLSVRTARLAIGTARDETT